ncbi:MAG TPA: porin [Burkholderiales bacterium]
MKKNAIALAVGALCIAPAAQAQIVFGNDQIGTMQIYGRLYPQMQASKTSGASTAGTPVSTMAVTSGTLATSGVDQGTHFGIQTSNSRLGFRGERRLGSTGMKAIWQLEQAINFEDPDDVAAGGGGVSGTDVVFATRNSFVGLNTAFGTVKLGNMDTIYKEYGDTLNMFGIKSGNLVSASNMLSHIGIGSSGAARFHERTPNSIQYETPTFAGLTLGVQYMPDERHGDPAVTVNKKLWSYGAKWEQGPFYVSLAHEIHRDFFGGSANVASSLRNSGDAHASSKDTATRLSAVWRFMQGHEFTFDIAKMKWTEQPGIAITAPRFAEFKHTNWALGYEGRLGGGWRTAAQFVQAGEGSCSFQGPPTLTCTTTGLKSNMISLALGYDLDRQTRLYAIGNRTNNGASARYDSTSLLSPARGADITSYALGISYTF